MRLLVLCPVLFLSFHIHLTGQSGCTDPLATNFDPGASVNDGSCMYPVTSYNPVAKTNLSSTLNEISGLVMAGGVLWAHNDSGSEPEIYQLDTLTETVLRTVTIGGASNVDWEDIAFDGTNFYVGDFGNNANGNRTDLKIYKFPLSAIPAGTAVTVPASAVEQILFSYEDQTNFDPTGSNNTQFDCEALVYKNDSLHLFTKDWINKTTTHYSLPATAGTYQAIRQETLNVNGLVTAADISSQGLIVLLGYNLSTGTAFYWQLWDYSSSLFFSGNKRRIELGSVFATGQLEGICFRQPRYGYLSNENLTGAIPARLYSFEIGLNQLSPATTLGEPSPFCLHFPNPVAAGQPLQLPGHLPDDAQLEIWTVQGKLVWRGNVGSQALHSFTPGTYVLWLSSRAEGWLCREVLFVY